VKRHKWPTGSRSAGETTEREYMELSGGSQRDSCTAHQNLYIYPSFNSASCLRSFRRRETTPHSFALCFIKAWIHLKILDTISRINFPFLYVKTSIQAQSRNVSGNVLNLAEGSV
jgi:hypothetical protein